MFFFFFVLMKNKHLDKQHEYCWMLAVMFLRHSLYRICINQKVIDLYTESVFLIFTVFKKIRTTWFYLLQICLIFQIYFFLCFQSQVPFRYYIHLCQRFFAKRWKPWNICHSWMTFKAFCNSLCIFSIDVVKTLSPKRSFKFRKKEKFACG